MMQIIMATSNMDKVKEIRQILEGTEFQILSLKEAGLKLDIEETGSTFDENAAIKAEAVRDLTGQLAIADDSGLVIDYLDGAPGIYSSRFMGEDTPYPEKNRAILKKLENAAEEERSARFVCSMAIAWPDGHTDICRGVMEGRIAYEIAGEGGFGYDPIFYLPERGCTSAQLTAQEKNAISHRGKALREAVSVLKTSIA
ncbi:MAG: XTP/dITP diphosphatase [Parasporobacterium sp.]|nr:XTP/dITP diphosphatase [Parasporobacterium sp.]